MKRHVLAIAIAASCQAATWPSLALAQSAHQPPTDVQPANPAQTIEEVVVIGQRAALAKALDQQRDAGAIINVANKDDMGKFPDRNAGETLQRLPGLSLEKDQGEGRFIRIRGLAPDYNAVTYNGTQLAAPEAGRRAVALDVIPAELLESVQVSKTLTPDMAAGSLGGTVELKSLTAFDREQNFYSMTLEGGYNAQAETTNPTFSGVFSRRFNFGQQRDVFGVAAALSYDDREFATDNVETGGNWDIADDSRLEEFEARDYQVRRKRLGFALNADYRPNDRQQYYLRSLYSRFTDNEVRQGLITEFDEPQLAADLTAATLTRELKAREEEQTMSAFVLGTQQLFGAWQLTLEAGTSRAEEATPYSIGGAQFEQDFAAGIGYQGRDKLQLLAPDSAYVADGYSLNEVEMSDSSTDEREHNIKLDLAYDQLLNDSQITWKIGAKLSQREKQANEDIWVFEDFADAGVTQLTLTDYAMDAPDYAFNRFGPAIDPARVYQQIHRLTRDGYVDDVESRINDFDIDEDVNAGYAMFDWQGRAWQVIAGARYEHLKRKADGTRYDDDAGQYSDNHVNSSDGNWLPAIITRYNLTEHTIVRGAYSSGLVRPSFEQLAPGYFVENDDGDIKAEFGNPELQPLTSDNLDMGIEHYDEHLGVLSAMLFYKAIDNFVYQADLAGRPGYVDFDEAVTFINGDEASVRGVELNLVHQLHGFDDWRDNLLLTANLTLTDSRADISWFDDGQQQSREIALPSQSDRTANLSIGYEDKDWTLRLAATYKSDYLAEVGELDDANYDIHEDANTQVDFSSRWRLNDAISIYFNANNLTDEPFYAYTGSRARNAQYEQYGRSYSVGIQVVNW
ncbi:TonB-dependent receptor [Idiomarina xiamenensis]|uniref:TonB-dependent receptor n=1 Tax=Idiomarina xiamenensis 10-D-4 TaxID=740709 RepID=K2KHG9_9GAMM|nr:TonB-dependent receptor [Idiomarina xiamenensis]EKE82109.1 hypothetical protein A10D4_10039 [Idiomarina xiamenensis 10-D-4]